MTRTPYKTFAARERRLCALRATAEGNGTSNSSVILSVYRHYGLIATAETVEKDLEWLSERDFVRLDPLGEVTRVSITAVGRDIAEGNATHPEITPRQHQLH